MNNDLISRSALINQIDTTDWSDVRLLVEDAPTVPQINIFCENADEKAIEDLKAELRNVLDSGRPKGEWKRHDEWRGGEYIGGFYHVNCPCIDLETALYSKWRTNFCPNCGAPMQKGEEE